MTSEVSVPRLERLSPEELEREFLFENRPVILTKALEDWPAVKWTLPSLREVAGSQELRVRGGDRLTWRLLCRVRADEYFDFLRGHLDALPRDSPLLAHASRLPYAAFNNLRVLERDIAFERLVPDDYALTAPMVWIGPQHSLTPMHYDASGISLFAQIQGRKRFILYPYEQTRYLYPSDIFDYQSVFSAVNLDAPDLEAHPEFARATPIEVIVGPGELLVIPNKMWHQVRALEPSISVTRRMQKRRLVSAENVENLKWYGKAFFHLLGLYKHGRCLCHIDELTPRDLAVYSPAIRFLVKVGGVRAHGQDLSDLIGWREQARRESKAA